MSPLTPPATAAVDGIGIGAPVGEDDDVEEEEEETDKDEDEEEEEEVDPTALTNEACRNPMGDKPAVNGRGGSDNDTAADIKKEDTEWLSTATTEDEVDGCSKEDVMDMVMGEVATVDAAPGAMGIESDHNDDDDDEGRSKDVRGEEEEEEEEDENDQNADVDDRANAAGGSTGSGTVTRGRAVDIDPLSSRGEDATRRRAMTRSSRHCSVARGEAI